MAMGSHLNSHLARQLQRCGWGLKTNLPYWVIMEAPDPGSALSLYEDYFPILSVTERSYWLFVGNSQTDELFQFPNKEAHVSKETQPLILVPGLEIGALRLSRALLNEMDWFLSNPSAPGGIARLADESQCVLPLASAQHLIDTGSGGSVRKAVTWKRPDYWHPRDLMEFRHESYQHSPGEWWTYTYRTFDPEMGIHSEQGWAELTNEYKLVLDDFETAYQVCRNGDFKIISRPEDISAIS